MFNAEREKMVSRERKRLRVREKEWETASFKWIMHNFIAMPCWIRIFFTILIFFSLFWVINSLSSLHYKYISSYIVWYLVLLGWEHVRDWLLNSLSLSQPLFVWELSTNSKWNATRVCERQWRRRQQQRHHHSNVWMVNNLAIAIVGCKPRITIKLLIDFRFIFCAPIANIS